MPLWIFRCLEDDGDEIKIGTSCKNGGCTKVSESAVFSKKLTVFSSSVALLLSGNRLNVKFALERKYMLMYNYGKRNHNDLNLLFNIIPPSSPLKKKKKVIIPGKFNLHTFYRVDAKQSFSFKQIRPVRAETPRNEQEF